MVPTSYRLSFLINVLLLLFLPTSLAMADAVDDGIKAYEAKNYPLAIEILKKQGLGARGAEANFYVGNIYFLEAKEGKRDFSAAFSLWDMSANKGYLPAQIRLGDAFSNNEFGWKDPKKSLNEAIKYYKSASNSGSAEAKQKLSLLASNETSSSQIKKFDGCLSKLSLPEADSSQMVLIGWTGNCNNMLLSGLGAATYQLPAKAIPSQPNGIQKMILANFDNGIPTGVALKINTSSDRVNVSRNKKEVAMVPVWFQLDVWGKGSLKRTLHNEKSQFEYGPISSNDYWYLSNEVDSFTSNKSSAYESVQGIDLSLELSYDAANQLGLNSINKEIIRDVLLKITSPEKINDYVRTQLSDDPPAAGVTLLLGGDAKPKKKSKKKN
jgi:hypothetical protein